MKLYKTTLSPLSNFATILKGDTLFGQMCWAIRFIYGEDKLKELLRNYEQKPFIVVSDGFAAGYLPKPTMPSALLGENHDEKKTNRKKVWLTLNQLEKGEYKDALKDEDIGSFMKKSGIVKNSLNYKTFMTDNEGTFSPYSEEEIAISKRDLYFLLDESFTLQELSETLRAVSQMGYGKNATIGKGFFTFGEFIEVDTKNSSKTFMTLSPSSLRDMPCKDCYYEPFTRFGKHGASLANDRAFKKPILLADSAAVVNFEEAQSMRYIGRAIKGHSSHSETVHQGYAIVVPIKEV